MRYFDFYESPMGQMLVVSKDTALCAIYFADQKYYPGIDESWRHDRGHGVIGETIQQLREYFAGERQRFDLALAPEGTNFQQDIWKTLVTVSYGETITYAELALRAGHARSVRAAGAANGRNPITIIVPCHRIIGSDGSLTGYGGGLSRKRALLE